MNNKKVTNKTANSTNSATLKNNKSKGVSTVNKRRPVNVTVQCKKVEKGVSNKNNGNLDNTKSLSILEIQDIKNACEDIEMYAMDKNEAGALVIFNQKYFDFLDPRNGTDVDVKELCNSFGRLGYNIRKDYIFVDLERSEILEKIETISNDSYLENVNCLVVAFLTHGDSGDTLYTRFGDLKVSDLVNGFATSKYLQGKPKLFLLQACKGEDVTDNTTPEEEEPNLSNDDNSLVTEYTYSAPQMPDIVKAYATVEGKVSFRHSEQGSWFIQEFCRNLTAFGRSEDVISLLTKTNMCVATSYFHELKEEDETKIFKQMPMYISTLRKSFYLTPSFHLDQRQQTIKLCQQLYNLTINKIKK